MKLKDELIIALYGAVGLGFIVYGVIAGLLQRDIMMLWKQGGLRELVDGAAILGGVGYIIAGIVVIFFSFLQYKVRRPRK